ncbi:MAG TPA: hypothetical protein VFQ71_14670 [Gaiellales bacterium]|nr:hypothetical protein [Gaiellales bacterium]
MSAGRWLKVSGVLTVVALSAVVVTAAQAAVGSSPVGAWQTNGRVEQIVVSGDTAYLGGQFTSMRPYGDPAGTGEVTRNHAAAIDLSTGGLLPWNPNANNTVQTLAVNGSTVYLGGLFSTVGGKNSKRLAAVDATTGSVIAAFKGSANAQVNDLAVGNGLLYLGGAFTQADGTARSYLAALDPTTGALNGWAPVADQQVKQLELASDGSRVYVGGPFTHMNGALQNHLAALDPTTGANLAWTSHPVASVVSLVVSGSTLYAGWTGNGGSFGAYNGTTGQLLWQGGVDGNVQGVGLAGGLLYVGGHFDNYCGLVQGTNNCRSTTPREHLLAVNAQTGAIDPWHPSANGTLGVFSVTGSNGVLALGGDFTKVGGVSQQGFAEMTTITDPTVTDTAGGQPTTAGSVTVTASGSTDSGPGFSGYRYQTSTDGGTTWSVNHNQSSVTISSPGTTLVRFQSYDAYGNTSNWITDTVTIQSTGTAQITFKPAGSGTVGATGNATIHGTYTCSGAGPITISGTLSEASTGAQGSFSKAFACPGNTTSTKWQIVVKPSGSALFATGTASEQVSWSSVDSGSNQPIGGSQSLNVTLS